MRGRPSPTAQRVRLRTPEQVFTARDGRRDGDRVVPLGPKARRTRAAVLAAAAEVLAVKGYQRTTMADVAEAADVSLGTVYQYFHDRADVVAGLVRSLLLQQRAEADVAWRVGEGRAGLLRVLRGFITPYVEHPALARVWEEVAYVDDDLAELRRALGRVFTDSVARELQRAVTAREIRPDLDVENTAIALTGMVDRYCLVTYVLDPRDEPPTVEHSAEVLADLWLAAIA
jgi:AcrR family transcriptional regulator